MPLKGKHNAYTRTRLIRTYVGFSLKENPCLPLKGQTLNVRYAHSFSKRSEGIYFKYLALVRDAPKVQIDLLLELVSISE